MTKNKKIILIGAGNIAFAAIITIVIFSVFGGNTAEVQPTLPLDAVLTAEQAQEDLEFMYKAVKQTHPCYLDGSGLDRTKDDIPLIPDIKTDEKDALDTFLNLNN